MDKLKEYFAEDKLLIYALILTMGGGNFLFTENKAQDRFTGKDGERLEKMIREFREDEEGNDDARDQIRDMYNIMVRQEVRDQQLARQVGILVDRCKK